MLCLLLAPLASPAKDSPQGKDLLTPHPGPGTIGLVLTDFRYALYETTPEAKEECPAGLQAGEVAQFKATPNHMEQLKKLGGYAFLTRGPNGENAVHNPLAVEDPLPWHEVKAKHGYGVNLDGTSDGHATAKTCKHEKFTSLEGTPVDNQMARVLGCIQNWRTGGFLSEFYSQQVVTSPVNRYLVEITGVDSEVNDPAVEIGIYKGRDRLVRAAAANKFVPYLSHRTDDRFPQFTYKTRGKIVDGVLISDPIPLVRMPMLQIAVTSERHLRDFTLRLKLTSDGAEGHVAGYEPLSTWWSMHSKTPTTEAGKYSPAGLYRALQRHADGYPDPKTGQCTAISNSYRVTAVRAIIVRPSKGQQLTVQGKPARVALARD